MLYNIYKRCLYLYVYMEYYRWDPYNHVRLSHGNIWYSYEVTRWSVVYYRTCRQTCSVGMMSYWLFVKPIGLSFF